MKPLWKVINIYMCADTYTCTYTYKYTYTYIYTYTYTCTCTSTSTCTGTCTCAFACACACVRGRVGREGEWWWVGRWVSMCWFVCVCWCVLCVLIPSAVSLNSFIRHSECLEESATCCSLDLFSNWNWVRSIGFSWWTSEARDDHTWANFGKQHWRWPPALRVSVQKTSVCRFKTSHVYRHHARMW